MGLPAHVNATKQREMGARAETLPELITSTQTGFERAVEIAGDDGADAKSRHDSMSHLRRCLERGTVGYSPITNDQRTTVAQIAYRMANADHWLERRAGLTALESMESRNLSLATAVDKAQRLDEGKPTEIRNTSELRLELSAMLTDDPALRDVVAQALEGGGGPQREGERGAIEHDPYSSPNPENE